MRYLKKYNEGIITEELRDFCEINLAYLVDDGFNINVNRRTSGGSIVISNPKSLFKNNDISTNIFKWNDIKDHFIPFLDRLLNKYSIEINKVSKTGITFFYISPSSDRVLKLFDNQDGREWYEYFDNITPRFYQPSTRYVLDDIVNDDFISNHYGYNCMDYLYKIELLVKKKDKKLLENNIFLNQRNETIKNELKDFCETNLAYLVDDGLNVSINFHDEYDEYDELSVVLSICNDSKKWSEIKDHIIPFLYRLRSNYDLKVLINDKYFRFEASNNKASELGFARVNLSYNDLEAFTNSRFVYKIVFFVIV